MATSWARPFARGFQKKNAKGKIVKAKPNKYHAEKTWDKDGRSFASKGEAACYAMLKLLEKAGEIEILQCQAQVLLSDAEILCKPDFKLRDLKTGKIVYAEHKGFETTDWRIKRRLWQAYGPAELRIYKQSGDRIFLSETIFPRNQE